MLRVPGRPRVFPPDERERFKTWRVNRQPVSAGRRRTGRNGACTGRGRVGVCGQHPSDDCTDILREAKLQPHRFRYWKTTVWDDEAVERALKILWYYERMTACGSARSAPVPPMRNQHPSPGRAGQPTDAPGEIDRQEFEYKRHGTVILWRA